MRPRAKIALFGSLVLLTMLGCGGSSPGTTHTAPAAKPRPAAPTRAAFVARLNKLCKTGNARAHPFKQQGKRPRASYDQIAAAFDGVRKATAPIAKDVLALTPPASLRPAFRRYTATLRRQSGLLKREAAAVRARDTDTVTTLSSILETDNKNRTNAAIDLGADNCGR